MTDLLPAQVADTTQPPGDGDADRSARAVQEALAHLEVDPRFVHRHREPPRPARHSRLADPLPEPLATTFATQEWWCHQVEAIDLLRRRESVVISTGTASGKSLAYQVPAVEAALAGGTALMLYPTKALSHDQLVGLTRWLPESLTAAAYDGDCSIEERNWVRTHASIVLTNPEMLHLGILANHTRWDDFLRRLRVVVVDEAHVLRGVFGSHVAHLLRRLRRLVLAHGGPEPTFALTSATIGNPGGLAEELSGVAVHHVENDTAARGERTTVLWNPAEGVDPATGLSPSLHHETATVAATLVRSGLRTLVFCRSRRATEVVANHLRGILREEGEVRAYRAGYLADERRSIETDLAEGRLQCVVTTNALELGIDIGGLDAVVLSGHPGTSASFRQQRGRAGRGTRSSLTVLVAGDDQLDQWIMRHPREAFRRAPEPAVVNPWNHHVLLPHLGCAADELPLSHRDAALWGDHLDDGIRELVLDDRLTLRESAHGPIACWSGRGAPAPTIGLRTASRGEVAIRRPDGSLLGTVDRSRACDTVHPGAVYLHQGASWKVTELDLAGRTAHVVQSDGSTWTQTTRTTDIHLDEPVESTSVGAIGVHHGRVEVTTEVTGFVERSIDTNKVVHRDGLTMPASTLDTTAVWWTFPPEVVEAAGLATPAGCVVHPDLPGALHAAEHAGIGILPLFAICDRWDVGGVSTAWLPRTGAPTVVIHDAHPGGSGVAPLAHARAESHLRTTLEVLRDCPCEAGCPSCVQSPKCGNGNEPLHKAAAIALLEAALTLPPVR